MRPLFSLLMLFCISCKTIFPENRNVKLFARSAKVISMVPGDLYQDVSNYRHQLKLVESSTIYAPDKIISRLNKILEVKNQFEQNAMQMSHSASLIESYADCLLALTDESYNKEISKEGQDLAEKLNGALSSYNQAFNKSIPLTVGNFIGGVVTQIGSAKLRQLQKKYLKSFVDTGSHIINVVCDYFATSVAGSLDSEMNSLDNQFHNIMTSFYDNIYEYQKIRNVNPFDYLNSYNPLYLEMKQKLDGLHHLQKTTIAAMHSIKQAHEKLRLSVNAGMSSEMIPEIQELYTATGEVQRAYKRLKN